MTKNSQIVETKAVTTQSLWHDVVAIKTQKPLIHNITNYVVMDFTANVLLALGASPAMAHALDEVADMCLIADALVINIGTLSPPWVESMHRALDIAQAKGIPTVFDPVGAGATPYRTQVTINLIQRGNPQVIRGNASEISAAAQAHYSIKGVDSTMDAASVLANAQELSKQTGSVVVISGPHDYLVQGSHLGIVRNGHSMMPRITGMGCAATALIGAFLSVNKSPFQAALHAMTFMGIAGELAGEEADGPGSFRTAFIDAVYGLDKTDIEHHLNKNLS